MKFRELMSYLHQIGPDEQADLIVGYDVEKRQGVGRKTGSPTDAVQRYSVRRPFDAENPNNSFLSAPTFFIAKNGRLSTNPAHDQEYYEIIYVLEGSIDCTVNYEAIHIPAGAMLLMAPDIHHHVLTCGLEDIAVSIFLDTSFVNSHFMRVVGQLPSVGEIYSAKPSKPWLLIDFGVESQTDTFGRMLLCSYFDPGSHSELSTELLLQLFLIEADSTLNRVLHRSPEGIDAELPRIARYVEVHCDTVTLSETAQRFGYAENYLSAAFRQKFGLSFTRYRNLICLQRAASLLRSTNHTVTEIAAEVGLPSLSHFYKLFAAEYNMAPAEYRANYTSKK